MVLTAPLFRMKSLLLPACLLFIQAGCSADGRDKEILRVFERHSCKEHAAGEVKAALRSKPPDLSALDRHAAVVAGRREYREKPGGGISTGMLLGESAGRLYALRVFRGSPAEAAGIMEGDRILEVNGVEAGPAGTVEMMRKNAAFRLLVSRGEGGGEARRAADLRKNYFFPPLIFGLYEPETRTAFVRIGVFLPGSDRTVLSGLDALAGLGAKNIVFDLRGSAGGLPDPAAAVLAAFAPKAGPVLEIRSRHKGYSRVFQAPGRGKFAGLRTAVLLDPGSARAAEVFAASLKELSGAVLIGANTAGDVSIRKTFRVGRAGEGLRLTVAEMFPPSGLALEGKGLVPDFGVPLDAKRLAAVRAAWSAADEAAFLEDPYCRKALAVIGDSI